MYSQGQEERAIVDYFNGSVGSFLDCGAYDGALFSNSLALALHGWTGLAIEPDPHAFCKLLNTYTAHKITDVRCLHAFVGTENGITPFYGTGGDAVNTASEEQREEWGKHVKYRKFFVPVITIRQVLDLFGSAWDFVNVDVEGGNIPLLQSMPLSEMQTKLICVEHQGRQHEVREYCAGHGLTEVLYESAENLILGRPK